MLVLKNVIFMVGSVCPEVLDHGDVLRVSVPDDMIGGLVSGDICMLVRLDRLDVKQGNRVCLVCDGFELPVRIRGRGGKFFKELTVKDAYHCGFNDLDVFKDSLKESLGCNKLTPLYYYSFEVIV